MPVSGPFPIFHLVALVYISALSAAQHHSFYTAPLPLSAPSYSFLLPPLRLRPHQFPAPSKMFFKSLPALLLLALLSFASAKAKPGFPMKLYRMCASFHSELCGPDASPPGPCLHQEDCQAVVCNPAKPPGSCTADPTLSWCEDACDFIVRQTRNPVSRFGNRLVALVRGELPM